jgi:hypothetical protein
MYVIVQENGKKHVQFFCLHRFHIGSSLPAFIVKEWFTEIKKWLFTPEKHV